MYNIVMFAYNEERHIQTALANVQANIDDRIQTVYLLANGCTDKTVERALAYKTAHDFTALDVVELQLGDKCNAWNHYVHIIQANAECHFFIDSDVVFSDKCFPILYDELLSAKHAPNIIAGYPLSGRNLDFYTMLVEQRSCFYGNLYGASARYIDMVRDVPFYLPIGLNWIDSFLTKAANTDIQFLADNLPNRVIYKKGVGFKFESLSPFKLADIKLYKNRIARYELGKIQELYLDDLAVRDWPRHMKDINADIWRHFEERTAHLGFIKKKLVKQRLSRLVIKESHP
ncbi:glycosyltransferase family A protein [Glaciecola siphonariae]|uniref:Glycosyltransferase family A protein n=1 Tax=Glaciecola siphonariae TaxID=521012 RepID=A0ABV9LXH2_9ALTE